MVAVAQDELRKIIADGGVPLISIDDTGRTALKNCEQTSLRIRPRLEFDSYIAVSHVWADGLGNPDDNALPFCQIKRLVDRVKVVLLGMTSRWADFAVKPEILVSVTRTCIS